MRCDAEPLHGVAFGRLGDGDEAVGALQQAQIARVANALVKAAQWEVRARLAQRDQIVERGHGDNTRHEDQPIRLGGVVDT